MKDLKTIFIVDDTELNVNVLMDLLDEKYDILASLDGESALEIIQEEKVDLILLDIMMPGIDGFEVCKRLKQDPKTSDIPIIFITSKTDDDSIEKAYEIGGVDYITKPFRAREVLSRIENHLSLKEKSDYLQNNLHDKTNLINELLSIGISLTSENNYELLLEKIMQSCKKLLNTDAGTLYLLSNDEKYLEFKIVHTDSLNIAMGGSGEELKWKHLNLYTDENKPNDTMVAVKCVLESRLFNFSDVYDVKEFNFNGIKTFDKANNYRTKSMLVAPIISREKEIIGVLQLLNKKNSENTIIPFVNDDEILISTMASLGAVSIHNHQLVENLENLLESFIKTIADTLEEKSQYTEHHVLRVASIVDLIAEEIHKDTDLFNEISFSEDELKELNMAALLHDIGKIITPEAVVDKATRLETIMDRINNISIRFDILRRDSYIKYIQMRYIDGNSSDTLTDEYNIKLENIDKDEQFLIKCNSSAFVSDSDIQRIQSIAKQKILINSKETNFLSDDELFNLFIQKGTLTNEERDIINNHVKVSYKMLKNLPFPKKYKNIPKIAGSHHKTVNGMNGYAADELMGIPLNIKERILAIADVFEALTSPERPYKKPYTLNESFKIISDMVEDGHLDKDIIKFILNKKIYLTFANKYLTKQQIDEVTVKI